MTNTTLPTIDEAQARLAALAASMTLIFPPCEIATAFMATGIAVVRRERGTLGALQLLAIVEREIRGADDRAGLAQ